MYMYIYTYICIRKKVLYELQIAFTHGFDFKLNCVGATDAAPPHNMTLTLTCLHPDGVTPIFPPIFFLIGRILSKLDREPRH